ncbi:pimeloyl-ACP methyl ester esterase BioH [Thalassotalea atypica]|uniref:pimeloyl-ACP methyl ester esterase BioH n=1 Tax=Thalassotalea atypica TaxID=2054316 RepID=UPI002573F2CD|nr:pimeloyl-ACP methyl ester esterase BioH [Thalassotalea atypica]
MAQKLKTSIYGQGQPIVFLHGWGLNSGVWQPVIDKIKHKYEIITVDLPGFGINHEYVSQPFDLKTIGEQIVSAVDKPAIYLGWSLGGLFATEIALHHQTQCQGLITVASSPCFKQQEHWPGIKPEYLTVFYQQLSKDIEQTLKNFLKIQAMGSPHIRQDLKELQRLVMAYPIPVRSALKSGLDLLDTVDIRTSLADITQPFLRIYGKLDSLVPIETAALVNELAPESDWVAFDKASHAPFISHQSAFITQLSQWLDNRFNE